MDQQNFASHQRSDGHKYRYRPCILRERVHFIACLASSTRLASRCLFSVGFQIVCWLAKISSCIIPAKESPHFYISPLHVLVLINICFLLGVVLVRDTSFLLTQNH